MGTLNTISSDFVSSTAFRLLLVASMFSSGASEKKVMWPDFVINNWDLQIEKQAHNKRVNKKAFFIDYSFYVGLYNFSVKKNILANLRF
jgi:hypothetical protein